MKSMMPNNSGEKTLVENCQKFSIDKYIKEIRDKIKHELIVNKIGINGLNTKLVYSKTGFGGSRIWFMCPICKARIGNVYLHPINNKIGCRKCLNLEYRSRRYHKMIEGQSA